MITYKVRIYPNKNQKILIDKMLWEAKCLYNWYLGCLQDTYHLTGMSLGKFDLEVFRKQFACKQLPSQVQQTVAGRVMNALKRFFSKQNRFPKYKSIRQYRSLLFPQIGSNCKLLSDKIQFAKLGRIKVIFDRPILGKPKTCTLKKLPSDKYYAFIAVDDKEVPKKSVPKNRKQIVGIDPGLEKFCTLSDGQYIKRPTFLKKEEIRLFVAQRKLSRKKKGSQNFKKAKTRVAKIYEKISNQRTDHHFKVAHWLANNYETLCLENLSSKFMIEKKSRKSKSLTKLATDVALYEFSVILHYMSNKYSSKIIDVDPHLTSQTCSECGTIVRKSLDVRVHSCPNCGLVCDRDLNAAFNILHKGTGGCGTAGSAGSITLAEIEIPGL